ncbi:extracellular solute-binding protein [Occultella gossypii]|uniref:Extracellular solute-binding protein n=1 Tax=Occultella gossypii TaxID=2800820 RepID=A0ABS7S5D9_9MICO|nr:extracellular solute-binding protein [Occultella gossypii]MBZ2195542.1 extracellular solute-binding protein [Occultella gossypii]
MYALASGVNCRAIVYRRDWAETPVEGWGVQEFGEWAASMVGPNRYAFGFEAKTGDGRGSSNVLPMLWSAGGNTVVGEPGAFELGFDAEVLTTMYQFYYDMVHTYGATTTDVATWGWEETDGGFSEGILGAYSVGPWIKSVAEQYPEVHENIGVAPLPNLGTPSTFWECSSYMIHADSKKQEKAWEFLLVRGEEYQSEVTVARGGLSPLKALNQGTIESDPEYLGVFAQQLEIAGEPAPVPAQPFMNNLFYPAMQELVLRGTDPAEMAETTMTQAEAVLAEVNG